VKCLIPLEAQNYFPSANKIVLKT